MKMRELKDPIIKEVTAYGDYPFEAIEKQVLELIIKCGGERNVNPLTKMLECFLQITDQTLSISDINSENIGALYEQFLGAINSDRFCSLAKMRRYEYSRSLKDLFNALDRKVSNNFRPEHALSQKGTTEYFSQCIQKFEKMNVDEEKTWLWKGWPVINRDGIVTWLRLYPIYKRLGREFTTKLHQICIDYYGARKAQRIVAVTEFGMFIGEKKDDIKPSDFKSSSFMTHFWRDFFSYYIKGRYADGVRITTLIKSWRETFLHFVNNYLIPSGLVAKQYGELPSPEPRKVYGSQTHIKKTLAGEEIKTKLLTYVPLQVTDQEAMELLFKKIQMDVDIIVDWAKWAKDDIWQRYQQRIKLAETGKAKIIGCGGGKHHVTENSYGWLTDRRNPEHLQNAAATFQHHGFVTNNEKNLQLLFPTPLELTAHQLAMPISGALLPHLILLVADHPSITPSYLEKLELFDKNEKLIGFTEIDGYTALVGRKDRRGPANAQQIIRLNNFTKEVVEQMIELTSPLRQYLRQKGDNNWRYLLLSCGMAFGYPNRIKRIASDTSQPSRLRSLAESLGNTCKLSPEERWEYVQRFSLPALRASAGVLVYLKERSVTKMAEALGHAQYQADLLSCYLPEPILAFFQERWIRLFQEGIIVEALKDSEYLLEASSFNSMEELHEFLDKHALKKMPGHLENPDVYNQDYVKRQKNEGTEIIFGVNVGILSILISLQQAVSLAKQMVNGKARYWAGIAEALIAYIESNNCNREDLKEYLMSARRIADPTKMEALVNE